MIQAEEEKSSNLILRYYLYKLQFVQMLLPYDFETRHRFSLQFLTHLQVNSKWSSNILWTDQAHFHLDCSVNTHNCRIWKPENPSLILHVPLQSLKSNGVVWIYSIIYSRSVFLPGFKLYSSNKMFYHGQG